MKPAMQRASQTSFQYNEIWANICTGSVVELCNAVILARALVKVISILDHINMFYIVSPNKVLK